jgi:hypothetical protein
MLHSLLTRAPKANPDFDFLMGIWNVRHRYLVKRLADCHDWIEFDGCSAMRKVLDGFGNVEESRIDMPGDPYRGMALRTWDPVAAKWSIYWLDSRLPGVLGRPVIGGFSKGIGIFHGDDEHEHEHGHGHGHGRRAIRVRFVWSRIDRDGARWEQAFSLDKGGTWETNWIMDFRRV